MSDPTQDPAVGAALAHRDDELGIDRLTRRPVIERILSTHDGERTLALIKATVAEGCTDAEVGHFLELCAAYGLDPFAREAWCAKGKPRNGEPGKLLIMVGRDGLRKIAQRNGLHLDGDVVHAQDEFHVTRTPDGNRTVTHSYSIADRGALLGAWAEVRQGGPLGKPMGFFYAPLSEYQPANASSYSPWSKQKSVMILAAAERQAVRQATPLSGLMAIGEDESANAQQTIGAGHGDGSEPGWQLPLELAEHAERVIERARELGHAGIANRRSMMMRLNGQSREVVLQRLGECVAELDAMPPVTDAETVDGEPVPHPLTLTIGGEVFEFKDTDDPYSSIVGAMESGPDAMTQEALNLMAKSDSLAENGMDEDAAWYARLADALRAQAAG